ncbi:hypothetical protein ACVOMT_08620 [Sphingomonas panni]
MIATSHVSSIGSQRSATSPAQRAPVNSAAAASNGASVPARMRPSAWADRRTRRPGAPSISKRCPIRVAASRPGPSNRIASAKPTSAGQPCASGASRTTATSAATNRSTRCRSRGTARRIALQKVGVSGEAPRPNSFWFSSAAWLS